MTAATPPLRSQVSAGATGSWSVAFDVAGLRRCVGDDDLAAMFGLEPSEVSRVASVVLSWNGRHVRRRDDPPEAGLGSMAPGLVECLDAIGTDGVACIGVAVTQDGGPVAMSARVAPGEGHATAAFSVPPDGLGAVRPMLAAVGVRPVNVTRVGALVRVDFTFDLVRHVESARLARFGRTLSCVDFFTSGVPHTGPVERGLREALRARLGRGGDQVRGRATALVEPGRTLTMTARTPQGPPGRPYGDLVPDGLLLAGLRVIAGPDAGAQMAACATLRERLLDARTVGGWAFQRGTLPTATDSALVLLGLRDATAVAELEPYAAGDGGYLPQLSSEPGDAEHMAIAPATAHWDQPDLFTTCLVRHLRRQADLPETTSVQWIRDRLATRSGLYTAGPWLVDLAVALAVADDPEAGDVRATVRQELLAARNDDGSFGREGERPLATAAAVCALGALGVRGRLLAESQLRLVESLEDEHAPAQVPFASTTIVSDPLGADDLRRMLHGDAGLLVVGGRSLRLTVYEDTSGAVTLGLAALALSRRAHLDEDDTDLLDDLPPAPARYRRGDVAEYVARDGMPPYVEPIDR